MISALTRVSFELKFYQISIRDAWEIHGMGQNSKNSKRVMRKTKMNQFIQIVNPLTHTHHVLWYTRTHSLVYLPSLVYPVAHTHPPQTDRNPWKHYLPANLVAGSNEVGENSLNPLLRNNQDWSKIKCLIDHPFRSLNTSLPAFWRTQTGCPKSQSCIHCNMIFPRVFSPRC